VTGTDLTPTTPPEPSVAALAHDLRVACMRVSRRVRFETTTRLAPHQFSALVRLQEQACSAGELAERERVTAPSMSRTVSRLVELGHVERSGDAADGRVVMLTLTDQGARVIAEERAERDAWMAVRLEGLSVQDRAVLRRATALLEEVVAR
jgi:DNA-binding MarR family transcriptional regulator